MVEVIPELVFVIGLFFAMVGYVVARGLLATWTHSIGYLLQWLAAHARVPVPAGFHTYHVDFGGPFRAVDSWMVTALQNWCAGAEIEMGYCLHGMEKVARYTAEAIDFVARETAQTFDWLLSIHLPKLGAILHAAAFPVALVRHLISAAIAHIRPELVKTVRVVDHTITRTIPSVVHAVGAGAVALPGWVIHLPKEIRNAVGQLGRVEHRLRKAELAVGATAFAATIANAWGIPLRCAKSGGPIARLARSMCGLPGHFLNDVFGLLADFFVLENICTVLPWVEDAGSVIGAPLIENLTDLGAGLCAPEAKRPGVLAVPALYLPLPTDSLLAGV